MDSPVRHEPTDQILAVEAAMFHAAASGVKEDNLRVRPVEEGGMAPPPRGRGTGACAEQQTFRALALARKDVEEGNGRHVRSARGSA